MKVTIGFFQKIFDRNKLRMETGLSILDVIIGMGLFLTAAIPAVSNYMHNQQQETTIRTNASVMQTINNAAADYIKTYYATLESSIPVGGAPTQVPISALVSTGFLPPNFNPYNDYGQQYYVSVAQPVAGSLTAVTGTTGGKPMPTTITGEIAGLIGAQGGFIPDSTMQSAFKSAGICQGSCAQGSHNAWQIPNISAYAPGGNPGPGHLVGYLTYNPQELLGDNLYRNQVPGQPNATAMNTSMSLNPTLAGTGAAMAGQSCANPNLPNNGLSAVTTASDGSLMGCMNIGGSLVWQQGGIDNNGYVKLNPPSPQNGNIDISGAVTTNGGGVNTAGGTVYTGYLSSLNTIYPGNWYEQGWAPQTGSSPRLCLAPYTFRSFGWGQSQCGAGGSGGGECYMGNWGYVLIPC